MTKFTKIGIAGAICSAVVSVATSIAYAVLYKKTNELPDSYDNNEDDYEFEEPEVTETDEITETTEIDAQPEAE